MTKGNFHGKTEMRHSRFILTLCERASFCQIKNVTCLTDASFTTSFTVILPLKYLPFLEVESTNLVRHAVALLTDVKFGCAHDLQTKKTYWFLKIGIYKTPFVTETDPLLIKDALTELLKPF